jgi:arylsulfatase A-like enzyme
MQTITLSWIGSCIVVLAAGPVAALAAERPSRPNIVFILADDLGYGDVKCFNPESRIATPNIDRLAGEGMRFTDAHTSSAVCSPTRYGLMTGRYNWRSRLKSGVLGGLSPRLIEPGRMTVASLAKQHGYHTACIGKWHLGMNWVVKPGKEISELSIEKPDQVWNVDFTQPTTDGPTSVGFDYYYGIAASLDLVPYTYIVNDRVVEQPTQDRSFTMFHGRDDRTTRQGPTAPSFDAANVLPDLAKKAVDYIGSRTAAAKAATPFFLYLPLASPHTPILPTSPWQGKSGLNSYADFVMQTDAAIGQVLKRLDDEGLADNTLVVVTSDNGCSPSARFDELLAQGHNPSAQFRGHKADIYEGGHRVPFVVRYPGLVKPHTTSRQLVCLTDFLATMADILGAKLPANAGEDSISFLPALEEKQPQEKQTGQPRTQLVSHSINGSFAIREGNWKLCLCPGSGGWSAPRPGRDDTSDSPAMQLFDLSRDPSEKQNLAESQAETVVRLTKLLEQQVANGRSTLGPRQQNTGEVDIRKAGQSAHQPLPRRRARS